MSNIDDRTSTRSHQRSIDIRASTNDVFDALTTPSQVRAWWGASRVVVAPRAGGVWAAAWGDVEDDPDYVTWAIIETIERSDVLVLSPYRYAAKSGGPGFHADFRVTFRLNATPTGCRLEVEQDGFPCDSSADAFVSACEDGWRSTLESLRRVVENR